MRRRIDWTAAESAPARGEVLRLQGIPPDSDAGPRVDAIVDAAMTIYVEVAEPRALIAEIGREEFLEVYRGEGLNVPDTPLDVIVPKAQQLALFAATIGSRVDAPIRELFDGRDFALGSMLDSVCSAAADHLAELLGLRYRALAREDHGPVDWCVLPYSPGYCGWHVSGQRSLFEHLGPEEIGITLNASCLMQPLKSVSGVLVAGPTQIHRFHPAYPFCEECREAPCRERMASVLGRSQPEAS